MFWSWVIKRPMKTLLNLMQRLTQNSFPSNCCKDLLLANDIFIDSDIYFLISAILSGGMVMRINRESNWMPRLGIDV